MDDELDMLMGEFMAVQQEKTNPLSERTVAEIMVKLHHDGLQFHPTTDGNEYITPTHLDIEIIDFVRQRGKANLAILPQIFNVSLELVESRMPQLLKGQLVCHNRNLLSKRYLNAIIMNIKQRLQIDGKIDLEEISISNEFSMDFTQKMVTQKLDQLNASLAVNQLVTIDYAKMSKAKILGFLTAVRTPINLDNFLKVADIQERNAQELIIELMKQNQLKGKYQNSYYIPDIFSQNQRTIINTFFNNNGYIEGSMLQEKYLIQKPEEWLQNNLESKYVKFGDTYLTPSKVEEYALQIREMLQTQGFLEISNVIPFEVEEGHLEQLLKTNKHEHVFYEGYCFGNQWLDKCMEEFQEKILFKLFFEKGADKNKKKGKKNKKEVLTQEQLQEALFNAGLAEYSIAEELAPTLMPIMLAKLDELEKKYEKELTQTKGFLNSNFLKYKSCQNILRNEDGLTRMLSIAQKQKKKQQEWTDPEFGPTKTDQQGKFALVYFDGAVAKGWPKLDNLTWRRANLAFFGAEQGSPYLKKSSLVELVHIIMHYNKATSKKVNQPILKQEQQAPFTFRFFVKENEPRYVLVDQYLPCIEDELFGRDGFQGLLEKAYSKLRYCYKATLGVGIYQLLLEVTGQAPKKIVLEDSQQTIAVLQDHISKRNLVVVIGEGEIDKKLEIGGEETGFQGAKPYCLYKNHLDELLVYPNQGEGCKLQMVPLLFKLAYVVSPQN